MVLLMDDNTPPTKWPLARVTKIHPGKDGNVRVITLRTQCSTYTRSIVKVAKLPIDVDTNISTEAAGHDANHNAGINDADPNVSSG